jgi:hypothetical protein
MTMIHPVHAMLLAKQLHHTLAHRAQQFRLVRRAAGTGAATDCLIPTTAVAPRPCRPDPRRAVARPAGRHRTSRTVQERAMP